MFDVADIIVLDMIVNGRRSSGGVGWQAASTPSPRMPWTLGRWLYWLAVVVIPVVVAFSIDPVWLGFLSMIPIWFISMVIDAHRRQIWEKRELLLQEEKRHDAQREAAAASRAAQEALGLQRENDSSWISRIPSGY